MNRPWWKFLVPVVFGLQCIAGVAVAQIHSSAISMSTGGAGRASVEAGDAVYLNPATIAHLRDRTLQSGISGDEWNVSLTDNAKDSSFPAGLAYLQRREDRANGEEIMIRDVRLSFANFIGKSNWAMGLTAHQYLIENPLFREEQVNADLGLVWTPAKDWGVGFVVNDFMPESKTVPSADRLKSRMSVGLTRVYKNFVRLRADLISAENQDFSHPVLALGYEAYLNNWVIFRLGYRKENDLQRTAGTAGLGLDLARFTLNYGYESLSGESPENRHSVDLAIPF